MNRHDLAELFQRGRSPSFLFFWGHQAKKSGQIGPSCLSQWWPASFAIAGLTYPTAEHWMMAQKARIFGDHALSEEISRASSPKEAKLLGRKVTSFDEAIWDGHKHQAVFDGNLAKFAQNAELRDYLLSTDDAILVEASPVDPIWGIGLPADDARALDPSQWQGNNLLGFVLMDVRDHLKAS